MKRVGIIAVICAGAFAIGAVQEKEQPKFVGVNKCRVCHMSTSRGNQFKVWNESKHATAYTTLGTDRAKEVAVKAGVEDDPQQAAECLSCHVTGHGAAAEMFEKGFDVKQGVQCEACHGPGSLYKDPQIMNAMRYKNDPEGTLKELQALGLIIPGDKECRACHNDKSPTYVPFEYEKAFDLIKHPNPNIVKK